MTSLSARVGLLACACFLAAVSPAARGAVSQAATSPRLRESAVPALPPAARGGGEVVLELEVDAGGTVTQVTPLRRTPPFTEALAGAVRSWRFEPAIVVLDSGRTAVPGRVLVVAVFRPASLYAGPTAGTPPQVRGRPSPDLSEPASVPVPPYPPTAVGDAGVIVEIDMTARAEPRDYRVVTPVSGFDQAALDTVRTWRFRPPRAPGTAGQLFLYAVLGFRAPLAPDSRPQR